jgi:hypothetical protein
MATSPARVPRAPQRETQIADASGVALDHPMCSVRAVIAAALAQRASLVDRIAAIDRDLAEAYARLAEDRHVAVPDPPTTRSVRDQRVRKEVGAAPKWPRGATCDADVLKGIQWGLNRPRQLWARLDWGQSAIKAAIGRLLAAEAIVKHGGTWTLHYTLAPTRPAALPRPVVRDGDTAFETVWAPSRTAPSLLGDRATRSHQS